jgi:hypothetical protein
LPEDNPVLATLNDNEGVYNDNVLMEYLQEALGPAAPRLDSVFSANAGVGYEAPKEFDIDLVETVATDYKGPTFE